MKRGRCFSDQLKLVLSKLWGHIHEFCKELSKVLSETDSILVTSTCKTESRGTNTMRSAKLLKRRKISRTRPPHSKSHYPFIRKPEIDTELLSFVSQASLWAWQLHLPRAWIVSVCTISKLCVVYFFYLFIFLKNIRYLPSHYFYYFLLVIICTNITRHFCCLCVWVLTLPWFCS